MRSINKILNYNFNREERRLLHKLWYTNWCGGKWGPNFWKIIQANIKYLKKYDSDKLRTLLLDIEKICEEHDVDFQLLRNKIFWFSRANYRFAKKFFLLIKRWAGFSGLWVASISFILLQRFWKEYFLNSKETTLSEIHSNLAVYI